MNLYYLGSALNLSGLYMIAGCGAAVSIKSGDFNLGGEGQIYLGGFVSAILLAKLGDLFTDRVAGGDLSWSAVILAVFIALCAAFLLSGAMALLSALLKILRKADFLFTSFIASAAIIPFIDGLISGPARSKTENLLATPFIPLGARLPSIMKPSPLNASFITAVFLCIILWFILNRSAWGRQITDMGISQEFSRYVGFANSTLGMSSAFISGGLHGLCGAAAILGTYFTCHQGFYTGSGWNAFSAALIAGANPLALIPSSLFMGFVTTYANRYALYNNFGFDISSLIQAVILFVIAFPRIGRGGRK
jgi:simple sugar transport system permease protein